MVTKKQKTTAAEAASPPGCTPPVLVEIPLGPAPDANTYCTRHLEVQLTHAQGETLRRVFDGLRRQDAELADGRHVSSAPDTVKWLLEAIGKAE